MFSFGCVVWCLLIVVWVVLLIDIDFFIVLMLIEFDDSVWCLVFSSCICLVRLKVWVNEVWVCSECDCELMKWCISVFCVVLFGVVVLEVLLLEVLVVVLVRFFSLFRLVCVGIDRVVVVMVRIRVVLWIMWEFFGRDGRGVVCGKLVSFGVMLSVFGIYWGGGLVYCFDV